MTSLLLNIFNQYVDGKHTIAQAAAFVAKLPVLPMPDRVTLDDWRVHVPMPLLEAWAKLSDVERIVLYVMAQSATHPYECRTGVDEPTMN
jgi:hypothetical protein